MLLLFLPLVLCSQAQLRYYNPKVHRAAFVLPQFAQKAMDDARTAAGKGPSKAAAE